MRVYDLAKWGETREAVLERDAHRCTIGTLVGGRCRGLLHVHHLIPVSEGGDPFDEDNCITACAGHHPWVESARKVIVDKRRKTCWHKHRTAESRAACERRLNRR